LPRLFVAVWPPEGLVEVLSRMPRPAVEGVRWTRPDQWHVTLDFLGSVDAAELAGLQAAMGAAIATFDKMVEALAGPRPLPLSPQVWALPVAGLDALAATVAPTAAPWHGTSRRGEDGGHTFRGHLTLARARRSAPRRVFETFDRPELTRSWGVREVTIVSSRTEPEGAMYEILARWPLPA
jgi:RNA 2',3'-cyclic 3'-phosphodiesterase